MSMRSMRGLGSAALAAMVFGAVCLSSAGAAYKPKLTVKMGAQHKKDVQGVVSYLKGLPKVPRWCFMAERLGILFIPPYGGIGHDREDGYFAEGAHFIGVDGLEYDVRSEIKVAPSYNLWVTNSNNVERLGREAVFSRMAGEVTSLVLANAKYHLQRLAAVQPEMRDMYLAFLAKLCYLPDGKSPYDKLSTMTGPHKQPVQYYDIRNKGCKFVDTEGNEHSYDMIRRKCAGRGCARWYILTVCAHHVGAKDILALFPNEVRTLRANYKKKMKELGSGTSDAKNDKE